jgi:hypothetical protein
MASPWRRIPRAPERLRSSRVDPGFSDQPANGFALVSRAGAGDCGGDGVSGRTGRRWADGLRTRRHDGFPMATHPPSAGTATLEVIPAILLLALALRLGLILGFPISPRTDSLWYLERRRWADGLRTRRHDGFPMATHPPSAGTATLEERGAARQGGGGSPGPFPACGGSLRTYVQSPHGAALSSAHRRPVLGRILPEPAVSYRRSCCWRSRFVSG